MMSRFKSWSLRTSKSSRSRCVLNLMYGFSATDCQSDELTFLPGSHTLPPLQKLRTIAERLRSMLDILAVRANNSKYLQLSIRIEGVKWRRSGRITWTPKVCFFWSLFRLALTRWLAQEDNPDEPTEEARNPEELFTVLVSVRSFFKFLNSHAVSTTTVVCTWTTLTRMAGFN